jgi:hypothetical protein
MSELGAEMRAAVEALTPAHRSRLLAAGVDARDLDLGMVGAAIIRPEGGFYSPNPDGGTPAFITPIRIDDPCSPETRAPDSAVRVGEIADLLAWRPDWPLRSALRVGTAEWLGAIGPQYCDPAAVPIWRSVFAWLRNGCVGLVPLSRSPMDVWRLLQNCRGGIIVEDEAHATELRRVLERPWPTPPVFLSGARRYAV